MGICWYCHWGWAKPVAGVYREALRRLDGYKCPLHFSASHIVWEDENFEDSHVRWCFEHFDEYGHDYTDEELAVVRWSLEELLKIPEDARCIEPEDYDGKHPELYPPTVDVERV